MRAYKESGLGIPSSSITSCSTAKSTSVSTSESTPTSVCERILTPRRGKFIPIRLTPRTEVLWSCTAYIWTVRIERFKSPSPTTYSTWSTTRVDRIEPGPWRNSTRRQTLIVWRETVPEHWMVRSHKHTPARISTWKQGWWSTPPATKPWRHS